MWNIGSLSGKEEAFDEMKEIIDVCCLQEVRWGGQDTRMLRMERRRYTLWWSGK